MNVFLSLRFQDFQVDLRIQLTRNPNHYIFVVSVIDVILKFGHFKFFFQTLELNLESGRITVIISDHSKNRQIAFQKPSIPKLISFKMLVVRFAGKVFTTSGYSGSLNQIYNSNVRPPIIA